MENLVRDKIVHDFAKWAALSSTRSGSPVKAREHIYAALDSVDFDCLFDTSKGAISEDEFNSWHRQVVADLGRIRFYTKDKGNITEKCFNVGWAAKIINVYLKTRCYAGGQGRDGLKEVIHPPLDNDLADGLKNRFPNEQNIQSGIKGFQIKAINCYSDYKRVLRSCRRAAELAACSLVEVDQFWEGTTIRNSNRHWCKFDW